MSYGAVTGSDGAVTSYIALTTPFTVPASCSNIFSLEGSIVAFDPGYGINGNTAVKCHPSAVTTWWNQGNLGGGGSDHTAVSLGPLTCAVGFSTVATYVTDTSSTQVMCCPNGYSLANYDAGTTVNGNCQSPVSSGQTITLGATTGSGGRFTEVVTTIDVSSSYAGAIGVVGWNIKQAVVQTSSNFAMSTTASTITSSATTGGSTVTSPALTSSVANISSATTGGATTTPGSQMVTNDSSSDELSVGAKAGIGIGVALGTILLVLLGVLIWVLLRRKKPQQAAANVAPYYENKEQPPPGWSSTTDGRHELAPETYNELAAYASPKVHEIDGSGPMAELPASRKTWTRNF